MTAQNETHQAGGFALRVSVHAGSGLDWFRSLRSCKFRNTEL